MSDTQKKSLAEHIEAGVRLATSTTFKKADIVKFIGDLKDAYDTSPLAEAEAANLALNEQLERATGELDVARNRIRTDQMSIDVLVDDCGRLEKLVEEYKDKDIANHDVQVGPLSCIVGIDHMLDQFLKTSPVKPEMKPNGTMFLSSDANRYYTKDEASSLAFAILILFKMISL